MERNQTNRTNREQLATARAILRNERQVVRHSLFEAIDYGTELFDAALSGDVRAVLDFMGVEYESIRWCAKHNLLVRWETASNCAAGAFSGDCDFRVGVRVEDSE